jgi:hypothetical protein
MKFPGSRELLTHISMIVMDTAHEDRALLCWF